MAERITIEQVNDLLTLLRTDASVDAKAGQVTAIKSGIKQHNVPDNCVGPLFEALRTASTSQHAVLVNAGFTGLNHLLTRLSRQEPKFLLKEAARTLPLIIDKLGDQKEKFRALAQQALVTLYRAAPMDVERSVRNTAMAGKNPRAKEASMHWLLQMHQEQGLQFRGYVPVLMDLLEDADGMVRDVAKSTVIELFRNAPNAAKSDLKKQLRNFKVRPAIEQAIVKELAPTSSASAAAAAPEPAELRPEPARAPRPNLTASVSSISSERPVTPLPDGKPEQVEPTYVNTQRELDEILREMHPWFEGKETEQNWLKREESITKLRRLMAGNAATDYADTFLASVRALLDGIIKAVTSLRTSLSKEGCSFVQELANTYGPAMDPMVELLMQTFIKLSAATKKITSQLANVTVDTIIGKVTYNARIMQHIWGACQDKNVQPRTYATGWLKTILNKEAHHRSHVEHTGGLDLIEKCIKKGLNDPNPGVRERMRATYWLFNSIWPARAEAIMATLDSTAQKLLEKDPHNPNSPKRTEGGGGGGGARPGLGLSKSTMGTSKPSIREAMLAKKKEALASKTLPARPGSAMSHFSPVRTTSNSSATSTTSSGTATLGRQRQEPTVAVGAGGLSVAPMRPGRRRPEMQARPATAGPYSVRTHDQPSVEQSSPPEPLRPKAAVTPKPMAASPKRTAPRPRPGHTASASESSIPTPTRAAATNKVAAAAAATSSSPRGSPARPKPSPRVAEDASSPSKRHEEFTMVMPALAPALAAMKSSPPEEATPEPPEPIVQIEEPLEETPAVQVETPSRSLKVYEDPFTEDDQSTPKAVFTPAPVLEDRPVNENAAAVPREPEADENGAVKEASGFSPDKTKQNTRLLDSGISKVKTQSLDVHGFRKLQGIIRENKAPFTDDRFDALLLGLFGFLESPLPNSAPEKVQDVKAQVLATIKLLLKKARDSFQPHISRGLESLLRTRSAYDARTHIVSGLELLADELVVLGDASEIVVVLTRMLQATEMDPRGCRVLSMGLHVLRQMVDVKAATFQPTDAELTMLCGLAERCLESAESGVRMDAVQLCVALHAQAGDARFWEFMRGVKDDPKSLITYYIVKRQRERETTPA